MTGEPERVGAFVAVAPVGVKSYKERLRRITLPVLAVWGEKDNFVSLERADLLVRPATVVALLDRLGGVAEPAPIKVSEQPPP